MNILPPKEPPPPGWHPDRLHVQRLLYQMLGKAQPFANSYISVGIGITAFGVQTSYIKQCGPGGCRKIHVPELEPIIFVCLADPDEQYAGWLSTRPDSPAQAKVSTPSMSDHPPYSWKDYWTSRHHDQHG